VAKKKKSKKGARKGVDSRSFMLASLAAVAIALASTLILSLCVGGKSIVPQGQAERKVSISQDPKSATIPATPTTPDVPLSAGPLPSQGETDADGIATAVPLPDSQGNPASGATGERQENQEARPAGEGSAASTARPGTPLPEPAAARPRAAAPREATAPGQSRPEAQKTPAQPAAGPANAGKKPEAVAFRKPAEPQKLPAGPRLIFVIDDVGYNISQLKPFLKLPFPITFAVLPGLPYTQKAAALIKAAGKELILHQPMESVGKLNPGPGAIYLSMSAEEAAAVVEKNLDSLPGAVGLNNHEGSAVSRDERLMAAVMDVAKRRGIYYLDSLTIADSAAPRVAIRESFRYWERDVFLDNSPDRVSMVHYIDVGKKKAEKSGAAVMIGHVWSAELAQTLSDLYPMLVEEGFSLSTISRVMLGEFDADSGD
jgi:polysaccharide deacetylase 2 family uncharacterized protein YibQ